MRNIRLQSYRLHEYDACIRLRTDYDEYRIHFMTISRFDTVSTTMAFIAYELVANPDVQEKLIKEVDETFQKLEGKDLTYEELQKMKYMDQVISEVLRMWPAAPVTDRLCVKDFTLEYDGKSIHIEKGISFMIPIIGFHKDEKYFPNPNKFDPDRFSDENKHNIDLNTYLPFGIGNVKKRGKQSNFLIKSIFSRSSKLRWFQICLIGAEDNFLLLVIEFHNKCL